MTNQRQAQAVWHLRKGMDRRFKAGHPWVYSNEIQESPKGISPGAWIELRDPQGRFLAFGYGNPQSLIAFRSLTRLEEEAALIKGDSSSFLLSKLKSSSGLRKKLGLGQTSHRLCFGEADGLPGLIIDRYFTKQGQVFVIQAHTAGASQLSSDILSSLQALSANESLDWGKTAVILRQDMGVRKLEGLTEEATQILQHPQGMDLSPASILVRSVSGEIPLSFTVDLVEGQKTGFFLDQVANIELAALRLKHLGRKHLKILDLFCYVGQWSCQLGQAFQKMGVEVDVTAIDASAQALEYTRSNLKALELKSYEIIKMDILKGLNSSSFPDKSFDLVISDPPALIKSRKDIAVGTHAYLQLATQVFRLVKPGGGVITCSCSGLLGDEEFTQTMAKAVRRNQLNISWVGRGGPAPDHPVLAEFPEGRYLKCWVGIAQ